MKKLKLILSANIALAVTPAINLLLMLYETIHLATAYSAFTYQHIMPGLILYFMRIHHLALCATFNAI